MSELSREELEKFWALEVPLEAWRVPEDERARALREARVQYASTTSNMGGKDTYWDLVSTDAELAQLVDGAVVLPPGHRVREVEWADRLDDGVTALWGPFHRSQERLVCARIPPERLASFVEQVIAAIAHFPPRRREECTKRLLRAKDAHAAVRTVLRVTKPSEVDALRFELLRMGARLAR